MKKQFIYICIMGSVTEMHIEYFRNKINEVLAHVRDEYPTEEICLIHGYMPKESVQAKGWSTEYIDCLNHYFPCQINFFYNGECNRDMLYDLGETIPILGYVIATPNANVQVEIDMLKENDNEIIYMC